MMNSFRTVAALTLAASVTILGAACSDNSGGPTTGDTPAASDNGGGDTQAIPDPCALLTLEETSAYAGVTFTDAEKEGTVNEGISCTWDNPTDLAFVQILLQRAATSLAETRAVLEGTQSVDGLGEDAFLDSTGTVWFYVDPWTVSVTDYHIDSDPVDLAKLAFNRL